MACHSVIRVQNIINFISSWASNDLAEDWDNVGLQVGDPRQPVRKILLALDADEPVLQEAETKGVDLIVTHHPPLFRPLRSVVSGDGTGRLVIRAVRAGISIFSAHTNLDRVAGGVNDVLADRLLLQDVQPLQNCDTPGYGRVGQLPETMSLAAFAQHVKNRLDAPFVLVAGDRDRPCSRVAVCGGSGGGFIRDALRHKADVYVTGDVKYHDVQMAVASGMAVIDAGHYVTELPVLYELQRRLQAAFGDGGVTVQVAQRAEQFRSYWEVV